MQGDFYLETMAAGRGKIKIKSLTGLKSIGVMEACPAIAAADPGQVFKFYLCQNEPFVDSRVLKDKEENSSGLIGDERIKKCINAYLP